MQNVQGVCLPLLCVAQMDRLKEQDSAILAELQEGDRTKGFLVDKTGYHRNTIYRSLEKLEYAGEIECIHRPTSLYTLSEN